MTEHARQAAKALRLAQEHAGRVGAAQDLREGDRFFPVENNGNQRFTVKGVQQDPSPVGNTIHRLMITTEVQPVFLNKFDKVVVMPPEPEIPDVEIHHWQQGHRDDPMTGRPMCLICGGPEQSPEHW